MNAGTYLIVDNASADELNDAGNPKFYQWVNRDWAQPLWFRDDVTHVTVSLPAWAHQFSTPKQEYQFDTFAEAMNYVCDVYGVQLMDAIHAKADTILPQWDKFQKALYVRRNS